jgi:hypothetical protein
VAKDLALKKEDLIVRPVRLVLPRSFGVNSGRADYIRFGSWACIVALSLWHMQSGQLCNDFICVCVCAACAVTELTTM